MQRDRGRWVGGWGCRGQCSVFTRINGLIDDLQDRRSLGSKDLSMLYKDIQFQITSLLWLGVGGGSLWHKTKRESRDCGLF